MIVHCDHCGSEIRGETALRYEVDEEIFYFCSEACLAHTGHLEPVQLPERDDRGVGSAVPVEVDEE